MRLPHALQVRRDTVPGMPSGTQGVRPSWAKLLPEMLRPLGYQSYCSGKWHIDGQRLKNGFDRSYSLEDHDRNFYPKNHFEDDKPLPPISTNSGYFTSIKIADHAIECLKEHFEKFSNKPFFHYLCFTSPHFPLQALPQDIEIYKNRYDIGWDEIRQERWQRLQSMGIINNAVPPLEREIGPPYHFPEALKKLGSAEINRPLPWNELNPAQRKFQADKMAIHAAMIHRMDNEIGRIVEQLKQMNTFEDTVVLFLSDNGASAEIMVRGDGHDPNASPGSGATFLCLGPGWSSAANTPLRRHKTWLHEGGISTPFIVHWPKGISARGELRHTVSHVIDIAPTLLSLAGGQWPLTWNGQKVPPSPGKNLTTLFVKDGGVTRDFLWWCHENNRAIRVNDWKLVAAGKDSPWELYDLAHDRGEMNNLAGKMPDKVNELSQLWQQKTDEFNALARIDVPNLPKKQNKK